jgi:hypothetical protein
MMPEKIAKLRGRDTLNASKLYHENADDHRHHRRDRICIRKMAAISDIST